MTRRRINLALLLAGPVGLMGLAGCGKKGPLKRPDGSTGVKVNRKKLQKKGRP